MQSDLETSAFSRAKHELYELLARLRKDHRGVAAVEFGLIVPIMFMLFVGSVEMSQALTVDRRVTQSASASADLVARAPVAGLSTSDVDGLMLIVNQLMKPYDAGPLTVNIVSVKAQTVGGALKILVDWSRDNHGATPYARNATFTTLPANLLAAGESVIVSETKYTYTPLIFSYFIKSAFDMKETFYLKPRNSSCVNLLPINCVTGATIASK